MEILFLGTSHGLPEPDRFCSSAIVRCKDCRYIIDAGAPLSSLLPRYQIRYEDIRALFVTHLDGDHFNGIFNFCDMLGWYYTKANPSLFFPEPGAIDLIHHMLQVEHPGESCHTVPMSCYQKGIIFDDGTVRVEARPTNHTHASYAFVLEAEGKRILFTGDFAEQFTEYPEILRKETYDLVICEGAHCSSFVDIRDMLAATNTKQMLINHIAPRNISSIQQIAETLPFPISIAEDGMSITI